MGVQTCSRRRCRPLQSSINPLLCSCDHIDLFNGIHLRSRAFRRVAVRYAVRFRRPMRGLNWLSRLRNQVISPGASPPSPALSCVALHQMHYACVQPLYHARRHGCGFDDMPILSSLVGVPLRHPPLFSRFSPKIRSGARPCARPPMPLLFCLYANYARRVQFTFVRISSEQFRS
jgi:hypothetical protein